MMINRDSMSGQIQKKYFCISYIFSIKETEELLSKNRFDFKNRSHILIVLGTVLGHFSYKDLCPYNDSLGRSPILDLFDDERIIFIRNNDDESLLEFIDALYDKESELNTYLNKYSTLNKFDRWNDDRQISRISRLIDCPEWIFWKYKQELIVNIKDGTLLRMLTKAQRTYFQVGNYLFVHAKLQDKTDEETNDKNVIYVTENGLQIYKHTFICDYNEVFNMPYKHGNEIIMSPYNNKHCLVFNEYSDNQVQLVLGDMNIGFFWICDNDILYYKKSVNLDDATKRPSDGIYRCEDMEKKWIRISSQQYGGKYSSIDCKKIKRGEVIFNSNTLQPKIVLCDDSSYLSFPDQNKILETFRLTDAIISESY